MRIRAIGVGLLAFVLASGAALASGGGGGAGGGSFNAPRQMTPEDEAKAAYSQGVRAVKQADRQEQAARDATDEKKIAKARERARKQYTAARSYFARTVRLEPGMHEAWNYVGYTSRKLGEYDVALAAYDRALQINPTYAEAIEYRGEAYLGLHRIEDAKGAYMHLFRDARALADQLMVAMQRWVAARRADAAVPAAELDAFAQWLDERMNIARQTAALAVDGAVSRWN
jgi:tetratricopeptide (TPR) repeat protein